MTIVHSSTYEQAVTGDEGRKWLKAIQDGKASLKKNRTWEVVDASEAQGRKILTSRWIFKVKDNGLNKARLVVRGCEQRRRNRL